MLCDVALFGEVKLPDLCIDDFLCDETREAVRAFHDKRAPDYEALRSAAVAETLTCAACGETGIRAGARFCPGCGVSLTALEEGVP